MKILVTGAKGFIGKNICLSLRNRGHEVFEYDIDSTDDELKQYVSASEFIVHLAGINRPVDPKDFLDGNVNLTKKLVDIIAETKSPSPVIFTSSTQAALDNPYGQSKKMAEDELFDFAKATGHAVYVYRLYNAFGKWCRPNYNSVIATFCYNVAHDIPLVINEGVPAIDFIYIDDIVAEFVKIIESKPVPSGAVMYVEPHYSATLSQIADALKSFKASRTDLLIPDLEPGFYKDLYSTYLTYLDDTDFSYPLITHSDYRGSFTEILKTVDHGQVSINISKPGVIKGNHYHMSKNEKYLVVSGTCEIKLRKIDSEKIVSYVCSPKDLRVIDIPPGYTHCISNIGASDSVTIMWANDLYDKDSPDTYFLPVEATK
jgi:UDP-2-acetamido-2,6-beta-L-arabino-hexul-4-ose reductase